MTYPQQPIPGQPYPQPGWPAPEPPKKKSKKWPWVVGAIVAVFVIAGVSGGEEDKSTESPTAAVVGAPGAEAPGVAAPGVPAPAAEAPTAQPESAPGLNTPVRDGKFEFTVTGVETGLTSIGDNPFLAKQAQGQFVVVTMTVANTGNEPKGLSPDNQKMFDTQGRKFTADTAAGLNLDSDVSFYDQINPGNAVTMKVVYDMPVGATPAHLEVHDSMFSGGERVNLQ